MATSLAPLSQTALSLRRLPPKRHRCPAFELHSPIRVTCSGQHSASKEGCEIKESTCGFKELRNVACGVLAAWAVTGASSVIAASERLPPLSTEPNRCERAFVGNTIGQANGVYDKPIDLRFCDYTNEKSNLKGKSLAAALMSDAKFDGADMSEVVMSKAYAVGASFKGTDFTNAVLDRVNFAKADLQGAVFKNTVLSGSTFNEAQLQDAVFEDTIIGYIDLQKICTNTTISTDGRATLGCRDTASENDSVATVRALIGSGSRLSSSTVSGQTLSMFCLYMSYARGRKTSESIAAHPQSMDTHIVFGQKLVGGSRTAALIHGGYDWIYVFGTNYS